MQLSLNIGAENKGWMEHIVFKVYIFRFILYKKIYHVIFLKTVFAHETSESI